MRKIDQTYDQDHPVENLKPHPRNPREGDVGAIYQSIEANGFYGAVMVQASTGFVVAGNHRLQAARAAGADTIPAIIADLTDEEATRILLVDNRTNDLATYTNTDLVDLLQELHALTGTLDGTGYDGDDLDALLAELGHVGTVGFPDLPDGDREPIQQMTFVLHDSQAEIVKEAIARAIGAGHADSGVNTNRNGNALAAIAAAYVAA